MICLVACSLASVGGGWWRQYRALPHGQSARVAMILSALIAAGVSAWGAFALMAQVRGPGMQLMLGLALILAGAGLLWQGRAKLSSASDSAPHGFIGGLILLCAAQLSEGAPFIIFSAALATREPWFAAAGGAAGVVVAGWLAASLPDDPRLLRLLRIARTIAGLVLLLTGVVVALLARGLL